MSPVLISQARRLVELLAMKEPIPRGRPRKRPEPERDKDIIPPGGPRKRGRPRKF
jgi:hypothetical protein